MKLTDLLFSPISQAATGKNASTTDLADIIKQYDRTARICGHRGKLWVKDDVENAEIDVNTQNMAMALTSWGIAATSRSDALVRIILAHLALLVAKNCAHPHSSVSQLDLWIDVATCRGSRSPAGTR